MCHHAHHLCLIYLSHIVLLCLCNNFIRNRQEVGALSDKLILVRMRQPVLYLHSVSAVFSHLHHVLVLS